MPGTCELSRLQSKQRHHWPDFVTQTGINRWAESNKLVVLYPQTKSSNVMPFNPQGCWDWWGYTDANYATRSGKQIQAVSAMVKALKK